MAKKLASVRQLGLKFLNDQGKLNCLAKRKNGVSTMHTKKCVTFDMTSATTQSKQLCSTFLKKKSSMEHSI